MALDCLTESLLALTDKMSLSVKCCMVYASIKGGLLFSSKKLMAVDITIGLDTDLR